MDTISDVVQDKKSAAPLLRSRRKLSIPVLSGPHGSEQAVVRRRFSNVGDAARKLSTSIGWRSNTGGTPIEEIVVVGRALCTLYIRTRLKRAGVFNRKLGLTRVRSAVGSLEGCGEKVREIFPGLAAACSELERLHPKTFTRVTRQTGPSPAGGVDGLLLALGHYLLRTEPTWGKVVAVYSVAGGIAVDVVRQGRSEHLHVILEDMSELLEERLAVWVCANGGWAGLSAQCKPQDQEVPMKEYIALFGLVAGILIIVCFFVKFCTRF